MRCLLFLLSYPSEQKTSNLTDFFFRHRPVLWNPVPLEQARAAAGGGRVLRDKDRMTVERRLLPIMKRRHHQPFADYLFRMITNRPPPILFQLQALKHAQFKAATEAASLKPSKRRRAAHDVCPHRTYNRRASLRAPRQGVEWGVNNDTVERIKKNYLNTHLGNRE